MLGGLQVFDYGPLWRMTCGLWTSQVAVLWLIGGAVHLWRLSRLQTRPQLSWRRWDKLQGLIFPAAFAGFAVAFPFLLQIGWYFWTAVAILGVAIVMFTTAAAAGSLISYCIQNLTAKSNSITVDAQQR